MVYVGMDVHRKTTTFFLYDPGAEPSGQYRYMTRPTTANTTALHLDPSRVAQARGPVTGLAPSARTTRDREIRQPLCPR